MLAAGWAEQALHDAVAVCGLFNMMNRLVEGLGITAGEGYFKPSNQIAFVLRQRAQRDTACCC
jgi:hypothetical protein